MKRSRKHLFLWVIGAIAATPAVARADDTSDLETLLDENVITTASKEAETTTVAPATTSILTAEDIRRYGIHSIAEALDFLSLGVVTSDTLHGSDVGARGVMLPSDQGSHFLLMVNGHYVNDPLFGAARFDHGAAIPMEMIDHIEVILGPGSVLYGSNAMLGVINVITKQAKDFSGVHVVAESEVGGLDRKDHTALDAYRVAAGAGYEFTMPLVNAPSELTVMFEYYKQKGPNFELPLQQDGIDQSNNQVTRFSRDPSTWNGLYGGTVRNAYFTEQPAMLLRLVSGEIELNVQLSSYKRGWPFLSVAGESDFDDANSYELDRAVHADLKHKKQISKVTSLLSRLYADGYDYQRNIDTSQANLCLFDGTVTCSFHQVGRARWVGLEEQISFDWNEDGKVITLAGFDARALGVSHKLDTLDFDTQQYLASSTNVIHRNSAIFAAYLQQTWQPAKWVALNAGARLDDYARFSPVVSPRIAASLMPWKDGTLKLIYAEAFRAPTWSETDLAGPAQIQAQDLKPERVRSVEASIEQKFHAQRVLFGVFRSWWSDLVENHFLTFNEIQAAQAAGQIGFLVNEDVRQFRNISAIDNYGLNFAFDGSLSQGAVRYGLNATASYARKRAENGVDEPLVVGPEMFGNAHASWDLPGLWPTFGLAVQYMGRRIADRAYDGFSPLPEVGRQVVLRATISGPVPGVPTLQYRVSGSWAATSELPYIAGVFQRSLPSEVHQPVYAPLDRIKVWAGLQWDFGALK